MSWRTDFEAGMITQLRSIGTVLAECGDRVLMGSAHEQMQKPLVVVDVSYRRDLALETSEWVAEVLLMVWHAGYDEAYVIADAIYDGMEGTNMLFQGVKVLHWRAVQIEPVQVDLDSNVKIFGVMMRCEALIDE